ncbi:MAG: ATP-binding protein [Pseudomonadota bacterium]|nr:ATP-binding protein [Pseudomonadota bacterium]
MRLLPKSLFGRLTLVLLIGLTATVLLSAWVQMHDRGQIISQAIRTDLIQRTAGIVQLLDALQPAERNRLLPLLSTPQTRIRLADEPMDLPQADAQSTVAARLVHRQLKERLGEDTDIRVALRGSLMAGPMASMRHRHMMGRARMSGPAAMMRGEHAMVSLFFIQIRLGDGAWVWFERQVPQDLFDWPVRLLITLGILLFGVTTLSLVAVRWVVRPLRELRLAADALGKDIHRPPVPESGPLEVAQTARAFNRMQRRIKRYVEDRARILAAISHDLKTPLTRIGLRADLLDDEELGNKIRSDLDDMQAMVNATLDFMRGTEDREETRSLDLMALLESIRDDAVETGERVRLRGRIDKPYAGKPLALKRCIGNLVQNAVRYGGEADIDARDSDKAVTLTIGDNGPGIPVEDMEKVFEPFFRVESSRSRHTGGTGLGLGIARNIARAHGGDLVLKNRSEGGLIAELTLPR